MVNYACGFNQSETGKYFEWIIIAVTCLVRCHVGLNLDATVSPGRLNTSLYLCNWQSNVVKIPTVNISFTEFVSFKITVTVKTHTWSCLISINWSVMLHLFWLCAMSDLDSREIATRPALSRELQFQVECRSWFHVMQFIMTQRSGQSLKSLIQKGERSLVATKSC